MRTDPETGLLRLAPCQKAVSTARLMRTDQTQLTGQKQRKLSTHSGTDVAEGENPATNSLGVALQSGVTPVGTSAKTATSRIFADAATVRHKPKSSRKRSI